MRDYAKISPKFWIGQTGREIRHLGVDAQLMALYLLSCPNSTMIGVYYLPLAVLVHETQIPFEGASKALRSLCKVGFCSYDAELEYVWVHKMALYQLGGPLKPTDNRVKSIQEDYKNLPKLVFLKEFFEVYCTLFCLEKVRENRSPSEGPSKALRSQEQEQEQEKEQEQEQEQEKEQEQENIKTIVTQARPCSQKNTAMSEIFEHWKSRCHHPRAVLDDKRKKLIQRALKLGYSTDELCEAITGCSQTPHNMGDNDRGECYNGLHVILRDADQIDRFIRNAANPPRRLNAADRLDRDNELACDNWVRQKMAELATGEQQYANE